MNESIVDTFENLNLEIVHMFNLLRKKATYYLYKSLNITMDIENIFFIAPLHEFLANRHKTS
jgi:hypothetical protein